MDQTLLILLIIFVACSAFAMLVQAGTLLGMFLVTRRLQEQLTRILPEVQSIMGVTKRTVERVEKHVDKIGTVTGAILDVTKQQFVKVDELLTDASTRAKIQMERAEMVLDDTMTRTQQTVSIVQRTILRPVREVHGVVNGLRTAIAHLGRGSRPTVDHATSDEEMFI